MHTRPTHAHTHPRWIPSLSSSSIPFLHPTPPLDFGDPRRSPPPSSPPSPRSPSPPTDFSPRRGESRLLATKAAAARRLERRRLHLECRAADLASRADIDATHAPASPSPATSGLPTARSRTPSGRRRSGTASTSPRGRRWRSSGRRLHSLHPPRPQPLLNPTSSLLA
ncbi:hypothetical protein ACQJBY_002807 [Aegilops geniculata]